ncbi:hypothetical protein [Alkalihalobacillus trypoxylicola]|nr:hypothetical protein [Alkalihalobacillus trypoxylicola]
MEDIKEVILNDEQLQEKLTFWQKKLRLQDWIIEVRVARASEIERNRAAEVSWVLPKKMASICILDQEDYPRGLMGERDMENDLVHELLHLHFAPIHDFNSDNEHYEIYEEQAIESITYGLIALERT